MRVGFFFKRQRERRNLSHADVARFIRPGFEASRLGDFESFDDNDLDGWSLGDFKRYCMALDVQPAELADYPVSDLVDLPLCQMVQARREEKNWSVQELAERVGYRSTVIQALESEDPDEAVCLDALRGVAKELDIPFRVMLEKI